MSSKNIPFLFGTTIHQDLRSSAIYSNPILVATDIIVRITDLRKRQKMNIIDTLNDFINQTKESKEIKRALAVKMILSGKSYHEVKELLNVTQQFY